MNRDELLARLSRPEGTRQHGEVLPTGSPGLDILLGGGWPEGMISEISGPPGYADPLAYRTIAAVQRTYPGRKAVLCCTSYSPESSRKYAVDTGRLLVTSSPEQAVAEMREHEPCIAVIDRPLSRLMPVRADMSLSMLYLSMYPGDVRSASCVGLTGYGGSRGWVLAECMWRTMPGRPMFRSMTVSLGDAAFHQELLHTAILLGIVSARGRWHSYGDRKIAGSWEDTVHALAGDPALCTSILAEVAGQAPVYPGWTHAYAP